MNSALVIVEEAVSASTTNASILFEIEVKSIPMVEAVSGYVDELWYAMFYSLNY
jgi:hypothetical protein